MNRKLSCLRIIGWAALGVVVLLAAVVVFLFWPVNPRSLDSHPNPAVDYADALARVAALVAKDAAQGAAFNPLCGTKLLTHGQKTDRVVILVHGFTNCPNQYRLLAPRLYDQGYNVLLVPMPHHGLADRMNTDQGNLKAEELTAYADQVIDIAHGLGEHVTLLGFSLGGGVTAWAAEHRPDLDQAIIVSPPLGYQALPTTLSVPVVHAFQVLPDTYAWWDAQAAENCGPEYAYPRYSYRALASILRLGQVVLKDSKGEPLQAKSVLVVTNANEPAVSLEMIDQAVTGWSATSPGKIQTYTFPASLKLGHDIIDPGDKDGNIEVVYSKLIEMIQAQ